MIKTGLGVIAAFAAGIGVTIVAHKIDQADPPAKASCAATSDVTDLIARLKPLVVPSNWSYRGGVQVVFDATGAVELSLEIDRNNKYKSTAPSLREAVDRLTSPSSDIRRAVEGWKSP